MLIAGGRRRARQRWTLDSVLTEPAFIDHRGSGLSEVDGGIEASFDREWQTWLEQKAVRLRERDDLSAEREVVHTVLFERRMSARRAVRIIRRSRSVRLTRTNGRPRWVLDAIASDDLTDESVRHSIKFMLTVADACKGDYDGFGAMVVLPE
ncbi:ribonuclease E inhibitor RraB [Agreia sp. PsM10]|uniref:ribonuclease E inhibitor RraB n=1 Tax=Agreia sp. PsM10 TaxID=3030533 RepID=UPI00263A66A3|nr:ribonuclease E inhibitor RraB [Agreia sp. PsM10]MDN4638967.1 ribonuclease E inhibitor RraB [Agreia sp. PsM10]